MAIYRAQVAVPVDTSLPKDATIITPHFKVTVLPDPVALANSLATAVQGYLRGGGVQVSVKLYNAEDPGTAADPHPPVAQKTVGSSPLLTNFPRELALCLSYFADDNVKRRRGRLYLPFSWVYKSQASSPNPPQLRPAAPDMAAVLAFAQILKDLGGLDVDWGIWSRKDNAFHTTTNYYCDDEWDIQRRRGGRPTTRASGTGG